jgi:hypothetical protein
MMPTMSDTFLEIFAIARRILSPRYLPEPANVPMSHVVNVFRDNDVFDGGGFATTDAAMDAWFRTQEAMEFHAHNHPDPAIRTKLAVMLMEAEASMLATLRECERKVKARAT